jgi:serine/threonine protein kinase
MAEIYLARASGIEGFEKIVVLKRILPQHAQNDEFIAMFLDEARLAATLAHNNIAQTYDIGVEGQSYFFTMEYVHGEDLRNMLKQAARLGRGLPIELAVQIVLGMAAGLHHAHEKRGTDGRPLGIVHRDVSPSNVICTYDGAVKVVDFGIAKAATHRAESRVGTLKGKISYMSPEQCRGEKLDRRSDIFALGILLYELTTGSRLFRGENEFAILTQIVGNDVPLPTSRRPQYPPALERIVVKALQRDREQRYATMQDLQLDLESFARDARLPISSIALARYMEDLFGKRPEPWTELQPLADITPIGGIVTREELPTSPAMKKHDLHSGLIAAESSRLSAGPRRRGKVAAAAIGIAAVGAVIAVLVLQGGKTTPTSVQAASGGLAETPATVAAPVVPAPPVVVPKQPDSLDGTPLKVEVVAPVSAPVSEPVSAPVSAPATVVAKQRPVVRPTRPPVKQRPIVKPTSTPTVEDKKPPTWDPDNALPPS